MESSVDVSQDETRTSRQTNLRSRFIYVFLAGRLILISIWIFFFLRVVVVGLKSYHQWAGFAALHMTIECAVVYSDPMWFCPSIRGFRYKMHIFSAAIVAFAITACLFPGIALVEFRANHSRWGHLFIVLLELAMLIFIFVTGIYLAIGESRRWIYRSHKYFGMVTTCFMIVVLASGIFEWLSFPITWIIIALTVVAFVMMPIGMLSIPP